MIELEEPAIKAKDLYLVCVDGVRDAATADTYRRALPGIEKAEVELKAAAASLQFDSVQKDRCPSADVSKKMMRNLYERQLLRRGSAARRHYDNLRASAPHGMCPFCAHRRVTALDHFMPKHGFPDLAIAPVNLVPICSDCNREKLQEVPGGGQAAPLHPYFDRLGDVIWLEAEVVHTSPAALRYRVNQNGFDDAVLGHRVADHMESLGLYQLYAAEASTELLNIRHQLNQLGDGTGGVQRVRERLEESTESCARANPNSWRSAAYRSWSDSAWFCAGGFK